MYGRGIPLRVPLSRLYVSLRSLQSDRYRSGLIELLIWQIVPVIILSRHAIDLHTQYFFMLLPGSFILIGIFFAHVLNWLQRRQGWPRQIRFAFYAFVFLLVAAQTIGSTVWLLDTTHTNTSDDKFTPYHNDLRSLKGALNDADTLAQTHHLNHVYVATDVANQDALGYLNEQMPIHTPTTLFDATRCLVLPNTANGPAVLLVGPHNELADALVTHFAQATLVSTPARLGGAPFHLYLVSSLSEGTAPKNALLGNDLQLLDPSTHTLSITQKSWQVTRWSLLRPQAPRSRTTYNYALTATDSNNPTHHMTNTFNTISAGDQLLVAFPQPKAASMNIGAKFFMGVPFNPTYGLFRLETDTSQQTQWVGLQTPDGKNTVQVS